NSGPPISVTVTAAGTTTTLTSSQQPTAQYGQNIDFTATVASVVSPTVSGTQLPEGTVSFFDSGSPLGTITLNSSAVAVFHTSTLSSPLSVGTHNITAVYNGDGNPANYLGSNSSNLFQVV